ncbi:MAG: hypothetical protein IKG30_09510 [Clostridiales bacterium]|nr:hypothetical protein [Clostridiales bacterium]
MCCFLWILDIVENGVHTIAECGMGFVLNRNAFKAAGDGAIKFCNNRDDDFSANKVKFTKDDINNSKVFS